MTAENASYTTKWYLFIIEHLYAFTLFFGKISILSFYWRMFRVANIQFAISILLTCSILWILVRVSHHGYYPAATRAHIWLLDLSYHVPLLSRTCLLGPECQGLCVSYQECRFLLWYCSCTRLNRRWYSDSAYRSNPETPAPWSSKAGNLPFVHLWCSVSCVCRLPKLPSNI